MAKSGGETAAEQGSAIGISGRSWRRSPPFRRRRSGSGYVAMDQIPTKVRCDVVQEAARSVAAGKKAGEPATGPYLLYMGGHALALFPAWSRSNSRLPL